MALYGEALEMVNDGAMRLRMASMLREGTQGKSVSLLEM